MKDKLAKYTAKIGPIKDKAVKHRVILFLIIVGAIYGLLLFKINSYSNIEPDQVALDSKLQEVKSTKIDDEAIQQIQSLQERNINIEALFDNGRDNPFQE